MTIAKVRFKFVPMQRLVQDRFGEDGEEKEGSKRNDMGKKVYQICIDYNLLTYLSISYASESTL